jgi:Holliday junction resolvasome RuvABC endonuclease subunit
VKRSRASPTRVLALDPASRGVGFAVLEGPTRLIDWGVKETRGKPPHTVLSQLDALLNRYQPEALVIEDCRARGSRRCPRVRRLLQEAAARAVRRHIRPRRVSRASVQQAFAPSGARTKYEIAQAIAIRFPELRPRVPPPRKPWMSEDARMSIFDAIAFALADYRRRSRRRRTAGTPWCAPPPPATPSRAPRGDLAPAGRAASRAGPEC